MEIAESEHEVGEVNSEGALVVHVSGGIEVYEITKIPSATESLVEDAKKDIFLTLELEKLLTDLNRASDFLYLAYMASVGTGELQARVWKRQKEFSDLCGLCVVTTNAMQLGSLAILDRLTLGYKCLLRADERRASHILSKFSRAANSMSAKCGELADGFRALKDSTQKDSETAKIGYGGEVQKVEELGHLRERWKANLLAQETTRNALNQEIEGLMKDITKEEAREDRAAFRESMGEIAKLAGALCHPLRYIFTAPGGKGDSKPSPGEKVADKALLAKKGISRRARIVGQMREKETLRHEAVEQIAELTSRLASNERQIDVEESARIALEIVSRALDNVTASFSDAQLFWDTVKAFCKGLADAGAIEDIEDEEEECDPAELVEYLKSPDFVRQAIRHLAGWAALASVCAEYEAGTEQTRRSVVDHIKASPDENEARILIPKFKKELQDELDRAIAYHEEKIKSLDAEAKRLQDGS